MKITKRQLKRIIKEEKAKIAEEFQGSLLDLDDYDNLRESVLEFAREFAANTGYETEDIIEALKSVVGGLR